MYEKFDAHIPRSAGTPSMLAGPKRVFVDRVEWHTIPDASTASSALQSGEMGCWGAASVDTLPALRRRGDIVVRVQAFPGPDGPFIGD